VSYTTNTVLLTNFSPLLLFRESYAFVCEGHISHINTWYGPEFSGLTCKSPANWKMLRGIYSAIYGDVNVTVSGGYVLQYVGGTHASNCFICVAVNS